MTHLPVRRPVLVGLMSSLGLALAAALPAAPSLAAEPAPLTVTSVAPVNATGGLSGWMNMSCAVQVDLTDGTPAADPARYRLRVTHEDGTSMLLGHGFTDDAGSTLIEQGCDDFTEDEAVSVAVVEQDADGNVAETSAPVDYTFEVVGHPTNIYDTSVMRDGRWTNFVGKRASVSYDGGTWEEGAVFRAQVWTSRTRTFTADDWQDNTDGNAAILESSDRTTPDVTWTPRPRDVGRWVWISMIGHKPGKADWTFTFAPEYVAPGAMPTTFFSSYGARIGAARVGRTVAMTAPSTYLTAKGKAAKVAATYRWMSDGRAIAGSAASRRSFVVPARLAGHRLSVRTWWSAKGYRTIHRDTGFGRVRR